MYFVFYLAKHMTNDFIFNSYPKEEIRLEIKITYFVYFSLNHVKKYVDKISEIYVFVYIFEILNLTRILFRYF